MTIVEHKFDIKEIVYICTDLNQYPHQIVGFVVEENSLLYVLQSVISGGYNAREYEISRTRDEGLIPEEEL